MATAGFFYAARIDEAAHIGYLTGALAVCRITNNWYFLFIFA
jgi:hypothetical protein